MKIFPGGVHSVMITPFDERGGVDYSAFEEHVARADANGAAGVLVAGSTGEFYSLGDDERTALVKLARSVLTQGKPVVVGANALNVSETATAALAASLSAAGADALLLLAPIFVQPSQQEIISYYQTAYRAGGIPIVAYNNPRRTGISFDLTLLTSLVRECGVVALKDSSADFQFMSSACLAFPEDLTVLTGFDTLMSPAMAVGADGVMSMAHQVIPDVVMTAFAAAAAGEWEAARAENQTLLELYRLMFGWRGVPYAVLKTAMNHRGWRGGVTRRPLEAVSEDYSRQVAAFLDEAVAASL